MATRNCGHCNGSGSCECATCLRKNGFQKEMDWYNTAITSFNPFGFTIKKPDCSGPCNVCDGKGFFSVSDPPLQPVMPLRNLSIRVDGKK